MCRHIWKYFQKFSLKLYVSQLRAAVLSLHQRDSILQVCSEYHNLEQLLNILYQKAQAQQVVFGSYRELSNYVAQLQRVLTDSSLRKVQLLEVLQVLAGKQEL
jgi:hypothetical protein